MHRARGLAVLSLVLGVATHAHLVCPSLSCSRPPTSMRAAGCARCSSGRSGAQRASHSSSGSSPEPEANLLTAEVQAEAAKVREAGLPRSAAGLQKAVVVTLKAVLAARGLDTSGQKAQLVARLLSVLQGE